MASSNTNSIYLSWNGVSFGAYWTEDLSQKASVDTEDMTAGAGATDVQRAAKLKDRSFDFMLIYDDATISTWVQNLKPGTIGTLIYGPEGNATGKPKFSGSMILSSWEKSQSVDKKKLAFKCSFQQAAAPTARIENGDTF